MKDDSEACAVFTAQGSSASQTTASNVMDVIERQPDCDGQATQYRHTLRSNWKMLPDCSKFPRSRSLDTWIVAVKTIRGSSIGTWIGKKVLNWECLFGHRKQRLFSSVYVDDINLAGKKQSMAHVWKKLMKNV